MFFTPEKQAALREWQAARAAREQERAELRAARIYASEYHPGSGNYVHRRRNKPKVYWTARKEQELELWQAEQERQALERKAVAKERARVKRNERDRRRRAEARSAGLPPPTQAYLKAWNKTHYKTADYYHALGQTPPKTLRWRKWWAEHRAFLDRRGFIRKELWDAALREDRRRARRIAKGLPTTPKTSTQRAAETRARKVAAFALRLISNWWSPALSETDAKAIIMERAPAGTDEMQVHLEYVRLSYQAKSAALNLNRFTIAQENEDGIELAKLARAIFNEVRLEMSTVDYVAVLDKIAGEKITELRPLVARGDLSNETWLKNLEIKSIDSAQWQVSNGSGILQAVQESYKPKERKHGCSDNASGASQGR